MAKTPTVHVNLRPPPELHEKLARLAERQKPKKSLNSLIVELLYEALIQGISMELLRRDPEVAAAQFEKWMEKLGLLEERLEAIEKKVVGIDD